MTSASDVLQMIKDNDVKFVDLRLTDTLGKEMHVTVPADCIDEDVFELGPVSYTHLTLPTNSRV